MRFAGTVQRLTFKFYDMKTINQPRFPKALLTGLFVGIIATVVCMVFNIFYRENTHFDLSDIINISSLIFFVNLVFLVIGAVYYGFMRTGKKGELAFIIVFVLLTLFFGWEASGVHRSDDPLLNMEFHHLLLAMVVIMGALASFGIPFLYHNRSFEEHVV